MAIVACSPQTTSQIIQKPLPGELALIDMMTGSFTSKGQSLSDTSYADITLHMYPIWLNEDADYLYVEQSLSTRPRSPYRQRVYKVEEMQDGSFKSSIYTLPNDSLFIGKWARTGFFRDYSHADLIERTGCAVNLSRVGEEYYSGATSGTDCGSMLMGANYATSIVEVKTNQITSWDQGFDDVGKQVWGAEEGPYIFLRKKVSKAGMPIIQRATK